MNFGQAKTARKVVGAVSAEFDLVPLRLHILYIISTRKERKVGYGIENF